MNKLMRESKEGFAEAEVVCGVLRIIKPGTFKDMLINKEEMTLSELKGFLRFHLGKKAMTDMFQELMCAWQTEQESLQQFLYHMIGLKQKLHFQSRQANPDISYDPKTIQEVFLHTIYQGLGAKHADFCQRVRPLISNCQVTNEEILSQVTKIINDENKHQHRFRQFSRQKTMHAHSTKIKTGVWQSDDKPKDTMADSKSLQTIQQLSAQVEALTHMAATLIDQQVTNAQVAHSLTPPVQIPPHPLSCCPSQPPPNKFHQPLLSQPSVQAKGKVVHCPKCTEQNLHKCIHCFACGKAGHWAVGCLKWIKPQGNRIQSLSRDSQRPMQSFSPSQ